MSDQTSPTSDIPPARPHPEGLRRSADVRTRDTEQGDATSPAVPQGQVTDAAAEVYETFFVPALFAQFCEPVLDQAGVRPGARVLDVGCGTGVLARAAVRRTGSDGLVAAIDPNEGMLAVARRADPRVSWRSGVAESLPFADGSFDHVISQFAAMFFTDRRAAAAEMARVCCAGGTLSLATWAPLHRTPGYAAMTALVADEVGEAAAEALRAPFVLGDANDLRPLLTTASDDVRIDEIDGTARFASIATWVHTDVRGWTLADLVDDDAEARLATRASEELAHFVDDDGSVAFPVRALVGTARLA